MRTGVIAAALALFLTGATPSTPLTVDELRNACYELLAASVGELVTDPNEVNLCARVFTAAHSVAKSRLANEAQRRNIVSMQCRFEKRDWESAVRAWLQRANHLPDNELAFTSVVDTMAARCTN
jgi:hypothetical protein